MTVKGGTSPACAVCKFQRRKCKPDCMLAPYFPANQSNSFQNVHRLFGVSNIMKILKQLDTDEQKEEAMKSIKYESDMRQRFPVYGCAGIICQLQQQLAQNIEELRHVDSQLAVYREQHNNNNNNNNTHSQMPEYLLLGTGVNNNRQIFDYHQEHQSMVQQEQPFMQMNQYFGTNEYDDSSFLMDSNNPHLAKDLMGFEHNNNSIYYDTCPSNNNLLMGTQSHNVYDSNAAAVEVGRGKQVYEGDQDSVFHTFEDDRQSYIDTKEDCESSSESFPHTSRDHQVCNKDLKNAAAYFSLTNTNTNYM